MTQYTSNAIVGMVILGGLLGVLGYVVLRLAGVL